MPESSKTGPSAESPKIHWRWIDLGIELSLALLFFYLIIFMLLGRYALVHLGVAFGVTSPNPFLLLIWLLLCARVWRNRTRRLINQDSRSSLRPGNWLGGLDTPGLILASTFLLVSFLFFHYGRGLTSDGVLNFVSVRSLVLDGDFNLTNEFEDFVPDKFQPIAERFRVYGLPPAPGVEPGVAFFWAPAFILTHGLVKAAHALDLDIAADGYTYPYIRGVALSSLLWGFAAVVLSYRAARRFFGAQLAAIAASVLWLSSTLLWYTVFEPTMVHAVSAAVVSAFLFLWMKVRESPSPLLWVTLGLVGGLMVTVQRYNIFYLLAPALTAVGLLVASRRWDEANLRKHIAAFALAMVAFLCAASPLVIHEYRYSRGELLGLQAIEQRMQYWKQPRIGEFLFSSNHGLFAWNPTVYLSVIGLLILSRRNLRLGLSLLIVLSGGVYLLSSVWDWNAGHSFGSRRLTEGFLIFTVGFCALLDGVLRRPKLLMGIGVAGLILWNLSLAQQVKRGTVPAMGTFSFSDVSARWVRHIYEVAGHPGSWPANLLFAWKYGLGPERFDSIYGHRRYHNLDIDVGTAADRFFLGRGWSIPETLADGRTFRWSLGHESTWLVPLFEAFDYRLVVSGEPAPHPQREPLLVDMDINGRSATRLVLLGGHQRVEARVPAAFWKAGINEIRFHYRWTIEAALVSEIQDPRLVSLRLERLELQIVQ